jgi:type II secretory pathway pseudopilin PulG
MAMGLSTPSLAPKGLGFASPFQVTRSMRPYASFTLVEMLVGVTIFSLLALMLFSITVAATTLWEQESAKEEGFREARAALTTLSQDLSGAVITTNTAWFYSNTNTVPQLAFLTTLPDGDQPTGLNNSDICAVGYSLEYTTNDAGSAAENVSLYRYVGFSGWTYTNVISGGGSVSDIFSDVDNTNVVKNLIARNVTQFTFTGYTNDPTGALLPENPAILPEIIDLSLTAVNERVAQQLTSQAMWQNSSNSVILRNQETFNLRARTVPQ